MDEELRELVHHGMQLQACHEGDDKAVNKIELPVDEIIEEYVGSFGFSQLVQTFLLSLAWMFDSQNTLVTIFSDAQRAWRCVGPSCPKGVTSSSMCELEPGSWDWVGGRQSSTIAEWGLVCDHKFRAGLPASLFFLGSLHGIFLQFIGQYSCFCMEFMKLF